MSELHQFDKIEAALEDIKAGKMVIVVDDENRENEGDFIVAAELVTPEMVNFLVKEARGYLCCAVTEERADELGLSMMVGKNTDLMKTAFTVTVDFQSEETSTGISASDRALTLKALANPNTNPATLTKPGHINPLKAKNGGVLRRAGHTEAAVDLCRMAGLQPVGVLIEIMNEDGSMARLPDLIKIAKAQDFKLISIADLIKYRMENDSLIERQLEIKLPTRVGDFNLVAYKQTNTDEEHLALIKGEWKEGESVMVRVHSSCLTGDVFGSCRCDCGEQLQYAMEQVEKEGKGVVLYMNQEGRGIGLLNKLKAYQLQEKGMDTVEANEALGFKADQRDYGVGAQILRDLGISKIRLLSNNPKKRTGLIGYGLEIVEQLPIEVGTNQHNKSYLETKRDKLGHKILGAK